MPSFTGNAADDLLNGSAGDDVIEGRGGADTLNGGDGADVIYGGGSSDANGSEGGITATRIASGFTTPLFAVSAPGDPDRLFVVEKDTGRIEIFDLVAGRKVPGAFLDIPQNEIATVGEQGLLGLAFHPDYETNGLFYINLTNEAGDIEIWAYERDTADLADVSSRELVMRIPHPERANHNGGWMGFGPDGHLYIATGDGGMGGANAQDLDSLLGKVLRIDVNGDDFPGDPDRNYAIPDGNPFVGAAGADEVYMMGLRNPWRLSFDEAGGLYIADVGQNSFEEINYVAPGDQAGANFGWPYLEGFEPYSGPPGAGDGTVLPVAVYPHSQGSSVTGGYVFSGEGLLAGAYVFADFISGRIWTLQDGVMVERTGEIGVVGGELNQIASFARDGRGQIYVIGLDGDIHRLEAGRSAGDEGDTIDGGAGDDFLYGGAGDDLVLGGTGADRIDAGLGADSAAGGAGADLVFGGAGDDILQGGTGADELRGGDGSDLLNGGADGDVLHGGAGADVLIGGRGADALYGGAGDDQLTGGQEADVFFMQATSGSDVITDFAAGPGASDLISFSTDLFADFADVLAHTANDGLGNCVISKGGITITLNGVLSGDLVADDFVFRTSGSPVAPAGPMDGLDPLVLPAGLESKAAADEATVVCPPEVEAGLHLGDASSGWRMEREDVRDFAWIV